MHHIFIGHPSARVLPGLADRETRTPVVGLTITAAVGSVGSVYHAVSDCRRLSEEFTVEGSVVLRVTAEVGQVRELQQRDTRVAMVCGIGESLWPVNAFLDPWFLFVDVRR